MNPDIHISKEVLREEMLLRRRQVEEKTIRETAVSTIPRIFSFIEQKNVMPPDQPLTIMSYMSFGKEFPTTDMNQAILDKGWRLVLPYTTSSFDIIACVTDSLELLRRSRMGIKEPDPLFSQQITAEEADLIFLPGVAFGRNGTRLGYGKGCYDRFLSSSVKKTPVTVALSWSFQIIGNVPSEAHDRPVDYLFTEKELIPVSDGLAVENSLDS